MQLQKLPSIWIDSGTTLNHSRRAATIDKTKRFQFDSIYYKDDPCKSKKKVDQFMFPHELLMNFRKNIRDASKSKSRDKVKKHKKKQEEEQEEVSQSMQPRASRITQKLYHKSQDTIVRDRDIYGNRASLQPKQLQEIYKLPVVAHILPLKQNKSTEKIYVTASQRLDLSRPNNFNPGPGAYLMQSSMQNYKSNLTKSLQFDESVLKRKGRDKLLKSLQFKSDQY